MAWLSVLSVYRIKILNFYDDILVILWSYIYYNIIIDWL